MKKIRVGVIGTGIIGESHIKQYLDNPGAEIVAVCDINEERLEFIGEKHGIARRFTSIKEMLAQDDIQAVDVCLHNNLHAPVSIAAMEAGKDVYCEKPMAGSFADALAMYNAMERTGQKLHIQLALIYGSGPQAAKKFIDSGKLGKIYHMRSYGYRRRNRPFVDGYATKEFVNTLTAAGGALFDMGVYHISQLLYLTGIPELERVTGATYSEIAMNEKRRNESGFNVEELGTGFAHYKGGLTMDIIEAWAIHAKEFPSSIICGSHGGLTISPLTFHTREDEMEMDTTVNLDIMSFLDHTVYKDTACYDSPQAHWVHVLLGRCTLLPTAKLALETQRVQEGVYLSHKLGREVTAAEIEKMSVSQALEIPNL